MKQDPLLQLQDKKRKTNRIDTEVEVTILLEENSTISLMNMVQNCSLSQTTIWKILLYDLKWKFYRTTSVQPLASISNTTHFAKGLFLSQKILCRKSCGPTKNASVFSICHTGKTMKSGLKLILAELPKPITGMILKLDFCSNQWRNDPDCAHIYQWRWLFGFSQRCLLSSSAWRHLARISIYSCRTWIIVNDR